MRSVDAQTESPEEVELSEKLAEPLSSPEAEGGTWHEVPLTMTAVEPAGSVKRVGPLAAAARRPWLVVLPIILVAVPGLIWGLSRTPTYRSQTELLVGNVGVTAQAVPGYVLASQQLAGTYARLVNSSVVVGPVAAQLNLNPADVDRMLTASAIAQSSVVIIEARTKDAALANQLVSSAAKVLASQVSQQQATDQTSTLLDAFNKASATAGSARLQVSQLTQSIAQLTRTAPGSTALASLQSQLIQKQADLDTATLNAKALGDEYQKAVSDAAASAASLQVIQDATAQGSDRQSKIQLAVAAALLLGGVFGLALATWAANRRS